MVLNNQNKTKKTILLKRSKVNQCSGQLLPNQRQNLKRKKRKPLINLYSHQLSPPNNIQNEPTSKSKTTTPNPHV